MKTLITLITVLFLVPSFESEELSGYQVGDYAKDFELKNVDGKMVSMSDYTDAKGFILSFTCNTCPYSKMYEQRIIDLDNKYEPKGYPVIAINPNDPEKSSGDSFDKMVELASEKNYPFPYLVDETQEVAKAFGATNTPHMYILQKEGAKYRVAYIGTIDNNPKDAEKASRHYIDEAMDNILSGQEVKTTSTKAVGCTIKWKPAS